MKLTKEEISAIADRLDDKIGTYFHDAIWDTYLQRESPDLHAEVSDEDVRKLKTN
jgi:hypothetical protein